MPMASESGPDANLLKPSGFGLPQRIVRGHSLPDYPANVTDAEKAICAAIDDAYVVSCEQRGRADILARYEAQHGCKTSALGVVRYPDGSEGMTVGEPGTYRFDQDVKRSINGSVRSGIRELNRLRAEALQMARAARRAA